MNLMTYILKFIIYFPQLPIGFKTFKDWIENRRAPSNRQHIERIA